MSQDPPAFTVVHGDSPANHPPFVFACDHASNAVPAALAGLGLDEAARHRHIAWDIGAANLTLALAARFAAPAVLAGYSRLFIDCNRRLDDPTSVVEVSDGQVVPGNQGLSPLERRARADLAFHPYHEALAGQLAALRARGRTPIVVAVHSFTPVMGGRARPWHIGILWDQDGRIAVPLLAALRAEPGIVVGDNEPYSGRHPADYTIDRHAEAAGLPHACLELRQDEIDTPAGVAAWARRVGDALAAAAATL